MSPINYDEQMEIYFNYIVTNSKENTNKKPLKIQCCKKQIRTCYGCHYWNEEHDYCCAGRSDVAMEEVFAGRLLCKDYEPDHSGTFRKTEYPCQKELNIDEWLWGFNDCAECPHCKFPF